MEQQLHFHQNQAEKHKVYITSGVDYKQYFMIALVVMLPFMILWHKRGGNKWLALVAEQIMSVGMVALMTYSKKRVLTVVHKYI